MSGTAKYMATTAATVVSAVPCILKKIVIGTTAAGAIDVYDTSSGTASDALRAELKSSIVEGTYQFDARFKNGCVVKCAAVSKITVVIE